MNPPYSYTWSGGIFNGYRNNVNWREQSIFALDFDNGFITIEGVYERFKLYDIVPQLWYYSFSHSETLAKFRVIYTLVVNSGICRKQRN